MRYITLLMFVLICDPSFAQTKKGSHKTEDKMVFTYVEQMPEFIGDMNKYLSEHIIYPKEAQKSNIEGRVVVKFMVNDDGSISDVQIQRSPDSSKLLDNEAMRVIKGMPKWKPGKQNGKAVNVWFMIPIYFRLEDAPPAKK